MSLPTIHHTLTVKPDLCRGCTRCMKRCPTGAIRIRGGKAVVDMERCIDCGQCMAVCPHQAIIIEQSDFQQIFQYKNRLAVVPYLLYAQFDDSVEDHRITHALHQIGFTHILLAESGVDILRALGGRTRGGRISVYADQRPVVSSYCPAVVRLVQMRYPSLLANLNLVRTPAQIAALFARKELEMLGFRQEETGIFSITPCAAKHAQIMTPNSATSGLFQGSLNLDSVFDILRSYMAKHAKESKSASVEEHPLPFVSSQSLLWSITKGESSSMPGRTLAVDEVHNVVEFLEMIEEERHGNLDFLELRACSTGCTGGILNPRNRFLATERIKHTAKGLPDEISDAVKKRILAVSEHLVRNLKTERFPVSHSLKLDTDISIALQKMEKARRIREVLPGIDCGLCGTPSCDALAEDIARGQASVRQCVVLKLKDPTRLNSLARIWGEAVSHPASPDIV